MDLKKCARCGELKPLEEFHKSRFGNGGRQAYCKACQAKCMRQWRRDNPDQCREHQRKHIATHRKRHQDRAIARQKITWLLKSGKLTPGPCIVCGTTEDIQAHHPDYSKPPDVVWICRPHHQDHHAGRLTLTREVAA